MTRPASDSAASKAFRRPTLSDIAREAGVSVGTASAILAGKTKERRISEELAVRVQKIAADLDYAPNLLVRSMQRGRTHMMSFFNGFRNRERQDYYMDALSTAIERAAGSMGYDIAVYCDFRRSVDETYRYLNGGRSDGLIFFTPKDDDPLLPHLRRSRLPVVLLNATDEEGVLSSVKEDGDSGLRRAATTLVEMGHRRIAALTADPGYNPDARARVTQLRGVLAEYGVDVPDRWVIACEDHAEASREAVRFLMAEPEPPTALFCWHDRIGYVVLEQCDELGISVPGQLSVIGYDGFRWPARTRHVLASIAVDLDDMGEAAVEVLDHLVNHPEDAPVKRVMPAEFVIGTTLAPARQ